MKRSLLSGSEYRHLPDESDREIVGGVVFAAEGFGAMRVFIVAAGVCGEEMEVAVFEGVELYAAEITPGSPVVSFLQAVVGLVDSSCLIHRFGEDVPRGMEPVVEVKHKRHVVYLRGVELMVFGRHDAGDYSLAVDTLAGIHPVEIRANLRREINLVAKSEIPHMLPFGLIHEGCRPTGLVDIAEISVPVEGIDHRQLRLHVVAIHLLRAAREGVEHLELELLAVGEIIGHVYTGHEVAHIFHHVAVFVDVDRVLVELDTSIGGALLTEEKLELVELYPDAGDRKSVV